MTPHIGIIGSGIIGLTSALVICESGYNVAIVARDMPGDEETTAWASPWAGAAVIPPLDPTDEQKKIVTNSFKRYWKLAERDPGSGVRKFPVTHYTSHSSPDPSSPPWFASLFPSYSALPASELPLGVTSGHSYTTVTVNPRIILPWLHKTLLAKNVKFIRAEVSSYEEARKLIGVPTDALVNATGLGAKKIAGDGKVLGIRGQTVVVTRKEGDQRGEERVLIRDGSEYTYVIPRVGTEKDTVEVVLGGVKQPDSFDEKVDGDTRTDILGRVNRLAEGAFDDVVSGEGDVRVRDIVGFRPSREGGFRIEDEGKIVHAYGFEGKGYCYSFGAAEEVGKRIEPMVME